MQIKSDKILDSQIKITSEVWNEIKETPIPADRWLGNYFHRNRKKIGARDRRFVSETIYSLFRHKTYYETWADYCKPQDRNYFVSILASALEGLISVYFFHVRLSVTGTIALSEALLTHELIPTSAPLYP